MKIVKPLTSFDEVNQYLRQFHDQSSTIYSLDTMRELVNYLGNPQEKFRSIHIAGTSGKTSTAYYVSALLTASGQKTGLTVSPHVDELNERIQINSEPLNETVFCEAMTRFLSLIEVAPVKPSWFEVIVAFAYWQFAEQSVHYGVIEVGLGGLKDGTNVIKRSDKVCVITDIGYDHMKTLGKTLSEIAKQKAGIIHEGNKVFTYDQSEEVMAVLTSVAQEQKANLTTIPKLDNSHLVMPDYQFRNWELAHQVYEYIAKRDNLPTLSDETLEATRQTHVPGRMDIKQVKDKTIVMDGAHNGQKMQAFIESFHKLYPGVKPAVLLAMRTGKEYQSVMPILASFASRIVITTFETTQDLPIRSQPPSELAKFLDGKLPVVSIEDQKVAYQELINGSEEVCVITGSFYLLGQIRNNENLI